MLDLMAGGTEGDEPREPLYMMLVVVGEDLVTFDGPLLSPSSANLAHMTRALRRYPFQFLPRRRRHIRAHVRVPGSLRHKLYGQQFLHARRSLSLTVAASVLSNRQVACTSRPAR